MNPRAAKSDFKQNCKPKRRGEKDNWVDLTEDLGRPADQDYSELQVEARERLADDQYVRLLEHPQFAFSVKQKRPDDAVAATLEMKTYVLEDPGGGVTVSTVKDGKVPVAAISATDKIANMMEKLVQRVE